MTAVDLAPAPAVERDGGASAAPHGRRDAATLIGSAPVRVVSPDWSWTEHAACKGMDTSLFFPAEGGPVAREVREVCADCPVRTACADHAERNDELGWWGRSFTRARMRPRKPIEHGFARGYLQHLRRGEEACQACKEAHAAAEFERAARRRERGES